MGDGGGRSGVGVVWVVVQDSDVKNAEQEADYVTEQSFQVIKHVK